MPRVLTGKIGVGKSGTATFVRGDDLELGLLGWVLVGRERNLARSTSMYCATSPGHADVLTDGIFIGLRGVGEFAHFLGHLTREVAAIGAQWVLVELALTESEGCGRFEDYMGRRGADKTGNEGDGADGEMHDDRKERRKE